MSIETEVKLRVKDIDALRLRLKAIDGVRVSERHFEDNYIMDFPDGRLRLQKSLLRLRYTNEAAFVTFKGAPQPGTPFKIREELETSVGDIEVALLVFQRLGFQVSFRYQKYREEYSLERGEAAPLHVALDETPIGSYAELEGAEQDIRQAAAALGFSEAQFIRDSYYGLYEQFCREQGKQPENMLFPAEQE